MLLITCLIPLKKFFAIIWKDNSYTYDWLFNSYQTWLDILKKTQLKLVV